MLDVKQDKGDVLLSVRVAPRSSRDAILGVHAGALKVSLTAPPVDGKANAALTTLLSKTLHVARTTITIERGDHTRDKTVRLHGIGLEAVQSLLGVSGSGLVSPNHTDTPTRTASRRTESS